jgi:hypothetical protein
MGEAIATQILDAVTLLNKLNDEAHRQGLKVEYQLVTLKGTDDRFPRQVLHVAVLQPLT